ncbi:MAG: helix-turn-helix transcriptional regulator [Lewinellaceae bacterium]|nr:helix-turn-helix transcriptional regulator [Saprospiraceae bacterium]MCB9338469.1 helix-turn-helix transcriptional regulator [Lewinellaceae bacterium]
MGIGIGQVMCALHGERGKWMKTGGEKYFDLEIGRRLSALRRMRKMSQEDLALQIGISFQQIQKYEKGMNRIAASRLYTMSRILAVSPLYFFDELCGFKDAGCLCCRPVNGCERLLL